MNSPPLAFGLHGINVPFDLYTFCMYIHCHRSLPCVVNTAIVLIKVCRGLQQKASRHNQNYQEIVKPSTPTRNGLQCKEYLLERYAMLLLLVLDPISLPREFHMT